MADSHCEVPSRGGANEIIVGESAVENRLRREPLQLPFHRRQFAMHGADVPLSTLLTMPASQWPMRRSMR